VKIALHGRKFEEQTAPIVQQIFDELNAKGAEIFISEAYFSILKKHNLNTGDNWCIILDKRHYDDVDFVFSVGGDGTLLETVSLVGAYQKPILGINAGRLGFLATTPKTNIKESIDALYNNTFTYDDRVMIRLESDKKIFGDLSFALNEFTILKRDTSSMIVVHTYIDGEYLNSYWADGLIVATPTGSTGYSLSCGGPVVLPHSNNFIITPVSPHNLNVRPMIVSDRSVISFEIEGRSKNCMVTLDSRSKAVEMSVQMAVRKEDFKARLVKFNGFNFLDTLRQKLNWGLDLRN